MKEKLIAGFMAALMTLVSVIYPVLGATALSSFPTFLGTDGVANFYVVMGSKADPSDVAGAVDIAARLAELSYTTGSGVSGTVTGLDRDGISLCASGTSTNCELNDAASNTTGSAFPALVLKNAHFSGLTTGTLSWNNADYKYHEQADVTGVVMRHKADEDKINGTEKMVVGTGGYLKYQYVFDQAINLTSYNSLGSISSPEYTKPVKIKMLGKDFTVVGAGSSSVKMLSGSSGTVTATQGIEYGDYVFYGAAGVSGTGSGASLQVKVTDKAGNPIETVLVLLPNEGETIKTTPVVKIKVLSVSALTDGTVLGAQIVVGPSGTTEVEYLATADTSQSKYRFPGETNWWITYTASSGASGYIGSGTKINVEYRPTETKYLVAGDKISLPNSYGELGFDGFSTNTFATVTVKPVSSQLTAYNSTDNQVATNLWGLEITADIANSIGSGNAAVSSPNWWNSMYLLFNSSWLDANSNWAYPVMVGYKGSTGKIYVNDTMGTIGPLWGGTAGAGARLGELAWFALNGTKGQSFEYTFRLNYGGVGESTFYLTIGVNTSSSPISYVYVGQGTASTGIVMQFQNRTAWTDFSSGNQFLRLGASATSAEDNELNVTTEGTVVSIGKKTQEIVDDSGLLFQNPNSNSGSDQVAFKVPNKYLGVHAHFGKTGGTGTTGNRIISPIKSAVALMDTEVQAIHKTKNFVSVGGPCVNSITAAALNVTFPLCGADGATALGIASGEALIKVVEGYPATGLKTVVVVGYEKENTRTASTVLQQYDTLLAGQTASAVKVTSATAAGITAVV